MVKFQYIEDYIQFIAGTRDINNKTTTTWLSSPVVSLARYDKSVVASFAEQIENSTGFTDKQSELAKRLVDKYRKQMHKLGVDCITVDSIPFRMAIRNVDRTKRISLKDNMLCLNFPYDSEKINQIKEFAKTSEGAVKFIHDQKYWGFALTESCVNWAHAFAKAFDFDIDPAVTELAEKIILVESQPYAIELVKTDTSFAITNAPSSLVEYVEQNGGFGLDNELWLLSMAAQLGYGISLDILATAKCATFLQSNRVHVSSQTQNVSEIIEYAKTYNKFPILSYNSANLGSVYEQELNAHFAEDEICYISTLKKHKGPMTEKTKLIHIGSQGIKHWDLPIPLLISYNNMSFGSLNSIMLHSAHKVCYYTATNYERDESVGM